MTLLPLVTIVVVYFFFAQFKPWIVKKTGWKICAICIAVSVTWIIGLSFLLFGSNEFILETGIFMGMSIVGLMYKIEGYFKREKLVHFWFVRLVIVIGGFYSVLSLLEQNWSSFVLILLSAFFMVLIPMFLMQGITHEDVLKENLNKNRKRSLINKLDDCC